MLGDYDIERQKFKATDGGDFNFGPVAPGDSHAPSACPDPENSAAIVSLFKMNPGMTCSIHWNQIMSPPRRWTLCEEGRVKVEHACDIESLRRDHVHIEGTDGSINREVVLGKVNGNPMELIAQIDPLDSKLIELKVLRSPNQGGYTRILFHLNARYKLRESMRRRDVRPPTVNHGKITIDTTRSSTHRNALSRPPGIAPVMLSAPKDPVTLRVFIDRCVVEVFVNDRQVAAVRVYPRQETSTGVSLQSIAGNAKLISLDAWQMEKIYE